MKLLLKRTQTRSQFGRPTFKLRAKLELEESERSILTRYQFGSAELISVDQPGLVRKALITGFIAVLVAWPLIDRFQSGIPFMTRVPLVGIIGAIMAWLYYDSNRETIYVRDLIHGRYFDCRSVIGLARKEAWLSVVTSFLRQVMESAKHWDGTEVREIEALSKEEAKYVVIRGL